MTAGLHARRSSLHHTQRSHTARPQRSTATIMVDGDDPRLHSRAMSTKSIQVPDRQKITATPAIDAAMAATSQLKRRFPRLITISSRRGLQLRPCCPHTTLCPPPKKPLHWIRLHAANLAYFRNRSSSRFPDNNRGILFRDTRAHSRDEKNRS